MANLRRMNKKCLNVVDKMSWMMPEFNHITSDDKQYIYG